MSFFIKFLAFVLINILCVWVLGLAIFGLVTARAPQPALTNIDVVVTFTGGKDRVNNALTLLAQKKTKTIFISGVNKATKMEDIRGSWTGKSSLPECCIVLGYEATTTQQNAKESAQWINKNGAKSIALLTSAYHMPRARLELTAAGIDPSNVKPYPIPYAKDEFSKRNFWRLLISEYHKTIYRWIQLKISS